MIKFYYAPQSSATRCHIALEELGVPYEKIRLHLDKGDQKKPDFLAINPNGKVPALVDGDVRLFESLAILVYLGEKYGVDAGVWPRLGSPEHGEALSWMFWVTGEVARPLMDCVQHGTDLTWAHPKEHRSAYVATEAKKGWAELVAILDKRLSGREWLLGSAFSIVDIAVGLSIAMGPMFAGLPVDGKNVSAWIGKLTSRPSVVKVMSEK